MKFTHRSYENNKIYPLFVPFVPTANYKPLLHALYAHFGGKTGEAGYCHDFLML